MKEKILEALKALGFKTEEMEELGYGFKYEGKYYIYLYNEDDENFLSFALPCVSEMEDVDEADSFILMNKLNATLKYVKANIAFGGITIFYERELFGEENLKELVKSMILHLDAALYFLFNEKNNHKDE